MKGEITKNFYFGSFFQEKAVQTFEKEFCLFANRNT